MKFKNLLFHKASLVEGIQICSNGGSRPFSSGDNNKIAKLHWQNLKNLLLQNHCANFNQILHKSILDEGDSNEELFNSQIVINGFFPSLNQCYDKIICVYWFEPFSQVSDVAHGPLVLQFLPCRPCECHISKGLYIDAPPYLEDFL